MMTAEEQRRSVQTHFHGRPTPVDARFVKQVPVEDGQFADAYHWRGLTVMVGKERQNGRLRWHLSVAHPRKLPPWHAVRDARYAFLPDSVTMALLLPPKDQYVNIHQFCMQMWEVDA